MPALTRRQTIAGIAATGGLVVVGGGAGLLAQDNRTALARSIIERSFGPFRMADDQFAALIADVEGTYPPSRKRYAFYRAATMAVPERALAYAPGGLGEDLAQYERRVVSAFMTRTDFLSRRDEQAKLSFVGGEACTSPFARFT